MLFPYSLCHLAGGTSNRKPDRTDFLPIPTRLDQLGLGNVSS